MVKEWKAFSSERSSGPVFWKKPRAFIVTYQACSEVVQSFYFEVSVPALCTATCQLCACVHADLLTLAVLPVAQVRH